MDGQCHLCYTVMEGCLTCSSSTQCTSCLENYTIYQPMCIRCSEAIRNCITCESLYKCILCEEGYYVDSTTLTCLEPSSYTWVAFLVVGVFLVAVAAFIIVKVSREQKEKKKEKDEEKSLLEKERKE
jgi:hypothetical protein